MFDYFKSLIDQEEMPVVICDTQHKILYMNPEACEHYKRFGGEALLGKNLLACHNPESVRHIERILQWFREDPAHNRVHTFYNEKTRKDGYMIALRNGEGQLIGYYEKQVFRTPDAQPLYEMA